MISLFIFGRQPELSLAELESLYTADKLQPVGNIAALVNIDPKEVNFTRLGGMVKFCKVLTTLETTNWKDIQKFLETATPEHAANLGEGKLRLGLSAYGLKTSPKQITATGLELKKLIRKSGRSVRLVPNKENSLNSAQVLHNQLTAKLGWELVFVGDGTKTIVAQSIAVQDIERYAARDQARPKRDTKVGMLPPKLAQIIINLALDRNLDIKQIHLLDPFCGTGVLLQEALLMGYLVIGSDIETRMIEYSKANIGWLQQKTDFKGTLLTLEKADATNHDWLDLPDTIAAETFLGRPLSSLPDQKTLAKIVSDCDTIHTKFLRNVARQTKPGFRMCIAVPAWKTSISKSRSLRANTMQGGNEQRTKSYSSYDEGAAEFPTQQSKASSSSVSNSVRKQDRTPDGFWHLPTLDNLSKLGYNRVKFVHVSNDDLIYHRRGQVVARELVVLERK